MLVSAMTVCMCCIAPPFRYSYPMQANMFETQFRKPAPNSTTAAAKPAHPATSRNQSGRHGNGTADNTSPSGRSHGNRPQQQSSKREHKSRGGGSKHTALPHPTDPFWGTFKTLLPTPDVPPITGVDLELGYPPLPDELAKEYGLDYYQVFVRDENCGKQQQQRSQQQRQQKQQQTLHQTRPVEAVKQGDSKFLNSTPTSIAFTTPHSGMEMTMVNAASNENTNHHQVFNYARVWDIFCSRLQSTGSYCVYHNMFLLCSCMACFT